MTNEEVERRMRTPEDVNADGVVDLCRDLLAARDALAKAFEELSNQHGHAPDKLGADECGLVCQTIRAALEAK